MFQTYYFWKLNFLQCFIAQRKLIFESYLIMPNFDFNYTFWIDYAPLRIMFGAKLIGKV